MSLRSRIMSEAKRAPMALSLNFIMTAIAAIGLWLAYRQSGHAMMPAPSPTAPAAAFHSSFSLWTTIAVFFSVSVLGASLTRHLYVLNGWLATLSSVVLAVLSLLVTTWAARQLGFGATQTPAGVAFNKLTYYGTVVLYLGLVGDRAFHKLTMFLFSHKSRNEIEQTDGLSLIGALMLAVIGWTGAVSLGQELAIAAFL